MCHKWPGICSVCGNHNQVLYSFLTYHRACNECKTMGATCGPGTVYNTGPLEFTHVS